MRKNFLVFGTPLILQDEIDEVVDCLRSGWLGTGPKTRQFEEEFRLYKGAQYAVALNSCTAALHLCMLASGVKPGDEVITSAMTFCATVNSIIHAGAKPVLADCCADSYCIDPDQIEKMHHEPDKSHHPGAFCRQAMPHGQNNKSRGKLWA